ncbi:MAG: alpha/beta hydrolase, partial [Thermoplasmata archaeon]|nr:alpha/beta hydrolase [Thermoplasmata archaeon]
MTPPPAVIVMAHGTTGTIPMVMDRYAEAFQAAGFAVLAYDHRNFGISDGEPRHEINPWVQARGYRDAVTRSQSLRGVDPQRVGIWGDSWSGGEALVAAAFEPRVKAVVVQCP